MERCLTLISFLLRDAVLARYFLLLRPRVRLSVTGRNYIEMVERIELILARILPLAYPTCYKEL